MTKGYGFFKINYFPRIKSRGFAKKKIFFQDQSCKFLKRLILGPILLLF